MDYSKLKQDIDQAVAKVCIQIIQEPLSYFSEADIQQMLVEELRKIKELRKTYKTKIPKGTDANSLYTTSLLHREYGAGDKSRIDVVVFDPEDVATIDNVNLKNGKEYLLPVYAFELGTEKSSNTYLVTYNHVKGDLEKLLKTIKASGTGYLIHFYKDITQSANGTKSRQKTDAKIEKDFKKVFENVREIELNILEELKDKYPAAKDANIKVLAILLSPFRNQKKTWGKCQIFDGHKWVKTDVSKDEKLRPAIRKQLEDKKNGAS